MTNPSTRLIRIAAILAIVRVATTMTLSLLTKVLVGIAGDLDFTLLLGYNCFTLLLEYGIQIGLFVCLLAAAKRWRPSPAPVLFKAGGLVGTVGAVLSLCVLLISTIYSYISYMHSDNLRFAEVGFMEVLMVISGNPISQTLLPRIAMIGLALCGAAFFAHPTKAVKVSAIVLAAAVGLLLILAVFPMAYRFEAISSAALNFIANVSTAVMLLALSKPTPSIE